MKYMGNMSSEAIKLTLNRELPIKRPLVNFDQTEEVGSSMLALIFELATQNTAIFPKISELQHIFLCFRMPVVMRYLLMQIKCTCIYLTDSFFS